MKEYVMGFAFDKSLERVALIKKNRPEKLAGFLNGVGGKVEEREFPVNAMAREFYEEAGVRTESIDWNFLGKQEIMFPGYVIFFFSTILENFDEIETQEDEQIWVIDRRYVRNYADHILPLAKYMLDAAFEAEMNKGG